jgi:hypothetical protein
MKTKALSQSFLLLGVMTALAGLLTVQSGTVTFDFNIDPATSGQLQLFGNAQWMSSGGVGSATNSSDGFLLLTEAVNSENGEVIFSDFDNGQVVQAFSFTAMVKIGDGTGTPADGISIAYVRDNDPILTNPTGGWSGIQVGSGVGGAMEEGSTTGISVGFDSYNNGSGDVEGLDIRVDGQLVLLYPMPTLNGTCTDATSIQTGPLDPVNPGTGDLLCWAPLTVNLDTNGVLNVSYKNTLILSNYHTTYFPSPGRLVMGARTGGLNELQYVDNIQITTVPAALALMGAVTGLPDGFSVVFNDSGASVLDTNKPITLQLNGTTVPTTSVAKNGGLTTVSFRGFPTLLAPGSTNQAAATAKDGNNNTITGSRSFIVPAYAVIPPGDAVPAASVDTSKVGFRIRPYQSAAAQPNSLAWTEDQLLGLHGANNADLSTATDGGYIDYTGVINFNIDTTGNGAGNFTPDNAFPGIPGANGMTGDSSMEVLAFVQFPAGGVYQFGVNSDDGFRVAEGKNPKDQFALNLGQFDGGRGATDSLFFFAVPQAGIYPFRLIWENGDGELPNNGANCEWFSVQPDGTKILINDPSPTNTTGIKGFYSGPQLPAYVSRVVPLPGATGVRPDVVNIQLTDAATQVNTNSIALSLNGNPGNFGITKSGGVTTVSLNPSGILPPASTDTATLVWSDNGTPSLTATDTWTFVVVNYQTLPADLASPIGSGDASKPGFTVQANQVDNTSGNTENNNVATESQLAGLYGPNIATLSGTGWLSNDLFAVTTYINWDREANDGTTAPFGQGNFTANNGYPEDPLPGITGGGGGATFESVAEGVETYVEFPTAGFYQMGVNSDDSFRLTIAESAPPAVLKISGPTNAALPVLTMSKLPGEGDAGRAVYGASPPVPPLTAPIVYMTPGGIDDPGPYPDVTGKIALLDRSGSSLGTTSTGGKCKAAQVAGAVAVIFATPGDASYGFYAGATRTDINIPCLSVPDSPTANLLRSYLTNGIAVTGTITGDSSYLVGGFNDGRGATDSIMNFATTQAGVYPMRLIFHQGGGGANCEWFSITPDGTKVLVGNTAVGGLKVYRTRTAVTQPKFNSPALSGGMVTFTWTGTGVLQQASALTGNSNDWSDVPGNPGSGYQATVGSSGNKYYRLKQ